VLDFSSNGPTQDGRNKPDLVAPGTHITGAASQDPFFASKPEDEIGTCDHFFPSGQNLYSWSTGTSHSAPLVSGAAALAFQWLKTRLATEPSPALVKALILNATTYLTGRNANDNLPGAHQGWGLLNLGRMFEATDRIIIDQSPERTFTVSGDEPFETTAVVADPSKEVRFMLTWTDAPGNAATNAPYVNQLNLEVIAGGLPYRGNHFSKQYSVPGGEPDFLNNVQGIRLPAGTTGPIVIRVRPTIIAGDGVPGNGIELDQDFAFLATNVRETPLPVLAIPDTDGLSANVTVRHSDNRTDNTVLPGEVALISIPVANRSRSVEGDITSAILSVESTSSAGSSYPTIPAQGSGINSTPFQIQIPAGLRCGSVAQLLLRLGTPHGQVTLPVLLQVGRQAEPGATTIVEDNVDDERVKWKLRDGFSVASGIGTSGSRSYRAVDPGNNDGLDSQLSSLLLKKKLKIPADAGQVRLSFFHIFNFEPGFDGGVLEISTDAGATWEDLGSRVIVGGYDGKVTDASDNPLGDRLAWTSRGRPGVFSQVIIRLDDFAGKKKIKLRFLAGFDGATGVRNGYTGWFIDDIRITTRRFVCQ
jgi:hypothetical protein